MKVIKTGIYFFSTFILIFLSDNISVNCKNDYNILVFPFQSFLPKSTSTNVNQEIISPWIFRMLYLKAQTESGQNISFVLNNKQAEIHTNHMVAYFKDEEGKDEKYLKNIDDVCNYNYKASNSYKRLTDFTYNFLLPNSSYATENIFLYRDIDLKQSSIITFKFVHSSNDTHNCFSTGLLWTDSPSEIKDNFFHAFKDIINSHKIQWTLSFTNPNEGKFIFGDIINNTNLQFYNDNDKDNYIAISQNKFDTVTVYYKIKFDKLIMGDYVNNTIFTFDFDIHKRYITVARDIYPKIKELYMLNENGLCQEVIDGYYHTIFCNKKKYLEYTNDYKKLKDFIFYYKKDEFQYNFTFTPKELFLEKDDYIYFFIGYGEKYKKIDQKEGIDATYDYFHLGTIFLEKYRVIFDDEAPSYLYILKSKETKEEKGDGFVVKIVIISLLIFVFCALLFLLIGKLFGKKLFGGRKKKANELIDDDYDYATKDFSDQTKKEGLFKDNEENGNENGA